MGLRGNCTGVAKQTLKSMDYCMGQYTFLRKTFRKMYLLVSFHFDKRNVMNLRLFDVKIKCTDFKVMSLKLYLAWGDVPAEKV